MFLKAEKNVEVKSVSLDSFTEWVKGILWDSFQFIQGISTPLFMILFGIGAVVLVLGALFGVPRMRGAGVAVLILGAIAYLIVHQAPDIVGVLEGFTRKGP